MDFPFSLAPIKTTIVSEVGPGIWLADAPSEPHAPDAVEAISAPKAWCSDAYAKVASEGIQARGEIGMTWEHDMHLFLKRAKVTEATLGDADYHCKRFVQELERRVSAVPAGQQE